MKISHLLLATTFLSLAPACDTATVPTEDGIDFRTTRAPITTRNSSGGGGWISNGLTNPVLTGLDPTAALDGAGLAMDASTVASEVEMDTIRYAVECALDSNESVTKVVDGVSHTFEGHVGLAPEWKDDACDDDCQQWVSACLLARVNASGEEVTLWMQGDHPALGTDGHPDFPVYEGSFFGNLFTNDTDRYLCENTINSSTLAYLRGRTCSGVAGQCGFTRYSDCGLAGRCTFTGGSQPTASNCSPDADPRVFHTITTYISMTH